MGYSDVHTSGQGTQEETMFFCSSGWNADHAEKSMVLRSALCMK
jgi:hypothetical protein